ncbi:MAG: KH domain-containing protein [Treponema sp.]|nr:KH domain-containing protein [Treponema sp.]
MEKDLIEFIAKCIVDDPLRVSVVEVEGDRSDVLELRVAEEDLGKVLGKQGRIAKAMRTVLLSAGTRTGRHMSLEIID